MKPERLTPQGMTAAANYLNRLRGQACDSPMNDTARRDLKNFEDVFNAYLFGEAFDRYVGKRGRLVKEVDVAPFATLVVGAEIEIVGIVDDETLLGWAIERALGDFRLSVYDVEFYPEKPEPVLSDDQSPAAKYFPEVDAGPTPQAQAFAERAPQMPEEGVTPPPLPSATPEAETPRQGPQTSAQTMPGTAPKVTRVGSVNFAGYDADGKRGAYGSRSSVDPSGDVQLMTNFLEFEGAVRRGVDFGQHKLGAVWVCSHDPAEERARAIDALKAQHSDSIEAAREHFAEAAVAERGKLDALRAFLAEKYPQALHAFDRQRHDAENPPPVVSPSVGETQPQGSGCDVIGCEICNPPQEA